MSMPDPTLGRVQTDGFNNHQQALKDIRSDINDGVKTQIQILSQWKDREEGKAERQRQRDWEAEQQKLGRDHQERLQKDLQEWHGKENAADRLAKWEIAEASNKSAESIADKKIWGDLRLKAQEHNELVLSLGIAQKDKDGNPIMKDGRILVDYNHPDAEKYTKYTNSMPQDYNKAQDTQTTQDNTTADKPLPMGRE